MNFVQILLVCSLMFASCNDLEVIPNHPFSLEVPVAFGTTLDECKKVLPKLIPVSPNPNYPNHQLDYSTYAIDIESKNSVSHKDLFMVGSYNLGFDNEKLVRISFRWYYVAKEKGDHYETAAHFCCEKFVNCTKFNFPKTKEMSDWPELSTNQYDIKMKLDYPSINQFEYQVELKK